MILTSRARLCVELPDNEFKGREATLTLAGRVYKARKWLESLPIKDSLNRIMDHVNRVRSDLGLPERGLAIADDPCRSLEDVSESDLEWMTMIANWCPNWRISAPVDWGMPTKQSRTAWR